MCPLGKVSTIWTPELAYAVGLITTDGCLSGDGRHIDFTSKDKDLAETFRQCLNLRVKIGRKSSGLHREKKYFRVQFGDVLFYRWLLSIGLTPAKSKSLSALIIPDEYFFDFLRGNFDGDGTIYSYWDPRWRSSHMFYVTFVSASLQYLHWLQNTITRLAKTGGHIIPMSGAFGLRYAKKHSLRLADKMYYADDIPRLERKFQKVLKIFATEKKHNPK